MKLYTEEQVLKFINDNFDEGCSQLIRLTPIELPSDEDIIKDSKYKSLAGIGWIEGAKWMRNKIQGGNK